MGSPRTAPRPGNQPRNAPPKQRDSRELPRPNAAAGLPGRAEPHRGQTQDDPVGSPADALLPPPTRRPKQRRVTSPASGEGGHARPPVERFCALPRAAGEVPRSPRRGGGGKPAHFTRHHNPANPPPTRSGSPQPASGGGGHAKRGFEICSISKPLRFVFASAGGRIKGCCVTSCLPCRLRGGRGHRRAHLPSPRRRAPRW